MMTKTRLNELIEHFADRKIGVIGDFFLDKYIEFDPLLAEMSLETGKVANQVVSVRHSPGAAGNIVSNLVSLGAREVSAIGFTGDDGEGYELRQDLTRLGCRTDDLLCVSERSTPVYLKPRDATVPGLTGERERYDTKNRSPLPEHVEQKLIDLLPEVLSQVDALIIADQAEEENCGVVTSRVREALEQSAASHPKIVFWVDSRRRIGSFANCILKPNQFEAISSVFPESDSNFDLEKAMEAGRILNARAGSPVFLTASERGMLVFHDGLFDEVPSVRIDGPIDPTGAGDSATSGAVLALASGASLVEAALIANLVASIAVCKIDMTGTAKTSELPDRLELWRSTQNWKWTYE
ncbi:MAG: bifunctional heptose 7-phosphate kinase/heptose 1-phosphate adenyltransferase [Armatimonadota bacterium]